MKETLLLIPCALALAIVVVVLAPINVRSAVTCTRSQLSVRLNRNFSDAAMGGQRGAQFIVKNISRKTCAVNGSPGVTPLDRHGQWIGSGSVYKAYVGDEVRLKPGREATFEIGYHSCEVVAQLSGESPGKCKASTSMRITLADIKGDFIVRVKIDGDIEQVSDLKVRANN
jgi:hypothetical protein